MDGNGDIDGLELSLLVVKDGLDALFDLLEGDGFFMHEGLGLAHWMIIVRERVSM